MALACAVFPKICISMLLQVHHMTYNLSPHIPADTGDKRLSRHQTWSQRLGVQYTKHQAITQDKSLSPHSFLSTTSGHWRICPTSHWQTPQMGNLLSWVMAWCLVYWTPSLWVQVQCPDGSLSFIFLLI